ncbi:MAG: hypothetical protein RBT68_14795 [Spirochaetia bacterium]|nr:hypothetical protein [Spirochaetia bacterium]
MTIDSWLGLQWEDGRQALIEPPRFSPVVADPSFLFPEETPDGLWNLFAHSAWGVHRYSSSDGSAWTDHGLAVWNAMRPFVRKLEPGSGGNGKPRYILLHEKYPPLALPLSALPLKRPWRSVLAMQESQDLLSWTEPRTLLEPNFPWMRDKLLGQAVSNPCLVEDHATAPPAIPQSDSPADPEAMATAWRLYFSAGLSYIEDCGFNEPRYIGAATGSDAGGPFTPLPDPLLGPGIASGIASGNKAEHEAGPGTGPATMQDTSTELGAGSMKVIRLDDGWLGLQNKIYIEGGQSRSALFVMRSGDGLAWQPAMDKPLVAPDPGTGWKSSHVYACDCRFREADGRWYLYFNARDGWRISEGRERIGRLVTA